ncbi:MAG: Plug domain-containing protein [Campylobacterota bacterium]|nr:Plug domain-containing protein [Campylobacterota bacterium]
MKNKITLSLITAICLSNNIYAKQITSFDTVTVTAQKMEENAQQVPISLSVFDEFAIEDRKMKDIKDIALYTPNLMFFDNGGSFSFSPTVRGLRTAEGTFSSSLGMFVDGVPILTKYGADSFLMDIEKVEVLKGPQGTLYGSGAEGGVINITTKKPTNETKVST